MSQDPWEMTFTPSLVTAQLDMEDNPLDLHHSMDERTRTPVAFTQDAADWLSEADRTLFVQGTHDTDSKAKEDAYAALAMPDLFFPRVRTPCPGHRRREGNTAY